MNQSLCTFLDEYLAHALESKELEQFRTHLANCETCRQAVEEQEQMDALLRAAVDRLEPVPSGLAARIRLERRVRVRRRIYAAAIALSGIAAAVLLTARAFVPVMGPTPEFYTSHNPSGTREMPRAPIAQVAFPGNANVITVPMELDTANATFVWVYSGRRDQADPEPDPSPREKGADHEN